MASEDGTPLYERLTALELLQLQQLQLETMITVPAQSVEYEDARLIREACIEEMEQRGRCVYCGGKHSRRDCHRLLSWDEMVEQLEGDGA